MPKAHRGHINTAHRAAAPARERSRRGRPRGPRREKATGSGRTRKPGAAPCVSISLHGCIYELKSLKAGTPAYLSARGRERARRLPDAATGGRMARDRGRWGGGLDHARLAVSRIKRLPRCDAARRSPHALRSVCRPRESGSRTMQQHSSTRTATRISRCCV